MKQIEDAYPLSPIQQGMLFHHLAANHTGVDIEQLIAELTEAVNLAALEQAWRSVVERHELCRTAFRWNASTEPVQEVYRHVSFSLQSTDWQDVSDSDREAAFEAWLVADRRRGFDLVHPSLMRVALFRIAEANYRLVWTFHHLLFDARSMMLILDEVFASYEAICANKNLELSKPRPFRGHIDFLQRQDRAAAEQFWRATLKGFSTPTPLVVSRQVEGCESSVAQSAIELPLQTLERLKEIATTNSFTLNTLMQAAWAILLSRYSGESDVIFGVVRAGRSSSIEGADAIAGMFINTLPLRIQVNADASLLPWLGELRKNWRALRPFEHTSLLDIQSWSDLSRDTPLFQTLFNFHDQPWDAALKSQGDKWTNRKLTRRSQPNYPLTLDACGGDNLKIKIVYDRCRFDEATIARLLGHLKTLLEGIAENPDQRISELPMLTNPELHQLIVDCNQTADSGDKNKSIQQRVEEQATRTPNTLAVADEHRRLTYGEFNGCASQLAAKLQRSGVGVGTVVAVCLERSAEMIVAQLAVLKAGGAYLPLDPAHPKERLAFILRDAHAPILLTDKKHEALLESENTAAKIICVPEFLKGCEAEVAPDFTATPTSASDLAYVIYTSGSTGEPKGVQIQHGSLLNLVKWHQQTYHVTSADRATQLANPAFDASVWELWPYLTAGASIHIPSTDTVHFPAKLVHWLAEQQVSLTFLPTPLAEATFDETWLDATALRAILTGGDKLHRPPPQNFPCPLFNHYGPTESTVVTTWTEVPPGSASVPPIGKPVNETTVYVLDRQGHLVPIGVPGELYIGGSSLARGYLNRPELTTEKFIANPFSKNPTSRLYKTGDLVRWTVDGNLEFLGRLDDQVKIRGHRIELGEIEARLSQNPSVREAAVVVQQGQLVACIVLHKQVESAEAALREHLHRRLPDYMVPETFEFVDALPLTSNGKVDRKTLEHRKLSGGKKSFAAPRTATERALASIWCEVLQLERIGVHDNFFRIGGHSLLAARMISRVRLSFNHELPMSDLFDAPTLEDFARRIDNAIGKSKQSVAETTSSPRAARNGHMPLSFAQERLWFLEQLHPDSASNNIPFLFRLNGEINLAALNRSFTEIIRRHEPLRTTFKNANGQPQPVLNAVKEFSVVMNDCTATQGGESVAGKRAKEEAARPFDLTQSPLLRAHLFRLNASEHLLLIVTHHIACDGWSMSVFNQELSALYDAFAQNRELILAKPAMAYSDFAEAQRQAARGQSFDGALGYWKQQLADTPTLELPTDRLRPALQSYRGAILPLQLPAELTAKLKALSQDENVTSFMLLLATFQILLHRYSGQTDVVVGSPIAGRSHPDVEKLVGMFLNMVCLRSDSSEDPTFSQFVQRTRKIVLDAMAHQDLPFEKIAEALQPERDLSRSPLFQAMFVLQNAPARPLELSGLEITSHAVHSGTSKFDLTVSMEEINGALNGYVEYSTDLFDEATIARMMRNFETLLEGVVANPVAKLSELPLLANMERTQLLEQWNDTRVDFEREKCVHQLFEEQVARTPNAVAAVFGDDQFTYRELNERADHCAQQLNALGVGPEIRVGICVERSLDMMVGLLGILKSGGCYVPLDPTYPSDRLAFMLEDSGAQVLLTQEKLFHNGGVANSNVKVLCIDALPDQSAAVSPSTRPVAQAQNLAYVIYTSGSTGKPKGVMLTHRNVVNFFAAMDRILGTEPGVWLAVTSISFDISVLELLWTLSRGYKVVIQPDQNQLVAPRPVKPAPRKIDFSLFYFASDANGKANDRYRLLIEGAKYADEHGFEAVWTPERHFHPFGGIYPNPSVTSAAIAMVTKRVQIRAGSVVLPLHHPVRVAEEWSVVDNLSKGRVGLSIASGWHADDFMFAPGNFANRREILSRNAELIQKLWRGESVSFPSGDGKTVKTELYPKPIRSELPIWLTSSGSPDTFRLAGESGFNLLTHLCGQSMEQLASKIAVYREACRSRAQGAVNGRVTVMLHTFVWKDRAAVHDMVHGPLREYLRVYCDLSQKQSPNGSAPNANTAEGLERMLTEAAERYFEDCGLFGDPESCLTMVEKLRAIGVDEIACLVDFGVAADSVLTSLQYLNELRERANRPQATSSNGANGSESQLSITDQIRRHQVTHLQCTPSLAGALALSRDFLAAAKGLKKCLLGGEALPATLAEKVRGAIGGELLNMYGPTETTVWSAVHPVQSVRGSVPIGRPIANTELYILDDKLQPAPIGVPGELLIGGEGVARGYLNRPELTQERFIQHPFRNDPEARLYRTGDLARYGADGTIEFLGRLDHQVKLHGHRIELGEIESILRQQPTVRECVVCSREDSPGDARLVAYVVPADVAHKPNGELRGALQSKLPDYMVPSAFVVLDKLPLTPNGKINRKALPQPERAPAKPKTDFSAPKTRIEKVVAEIWQELLGVAHVGLNDNFFDLGGHSLLIVKTQAKLEDKLGIRVPVVRLFQHPTISALARCLSEKPEEKWSSAIRDRAKRQNRALFGQSEMEVAA